MCQNSVIHTAKWPRLRAIPSTASLGSVHIHFYGKEGEKEKSDSVGCGGVVIFACVATLLLRATSREQGEHALIGQWSGLVPSKSGVI